MALLVAVLAEALFAHDGPAFPIVSDRTAGPYVISVWTHPDIGLGAFWVIVDPARGKALPDGLKVQVAVQPVSGRIGERVFDAPLDDSSQQPQYKVLIPFDRQEMVRARASVSSAAGRGEVSATVEITPVGPNRWEFVLFLLPFAGVAFLWVRAMGRKRQKAEGATRKA